MVPANEDLGHGFLDMPPWRILRAGAGWSQRNGNRNPFRADSTLAEAVRSRASEGLPNKGGKKGMSRLVLIREAAASSV